LSISARPTFFANNWDRFGGRALEILSCYVLAQRLGCRFSFFWPNDDRAPEMEQQLAFFSDEFISRHQIFEDKPVDVVTFLNVNTCTMAEVKSLIDALPNDAVLKVQNFSALPKFADESIQEALTQFSLIAKSVMSPEFTGLFDEVSDVHSQGTTIHGRFGDLLLGSFRQYVPITKYIDTISYRYLLERLKADNQKITFLTDSKEVTEGLQKILDVTIDIDYEPFLSETRVGPFYEQCIDLFTLASSRSVFAASSSAFSQFATMFGGLQISEVRTALIDHSAENMLDIDFEEHYSNFATEIRGPLESRDLVSFLQIHWTGLEFNRIKDLLERAFNADPDYVFVSCAWSVIQLLEGNQDFGLKIIEDAELEAQKVLSTHHDPLALVLLVKYCIFSVLFSQKAEKALDELLGQSPYQFYFTPYLKSWNTRISKGSKTQLSKVSAISRMFSHLGGKKRLRADVDLAKFWDVVMERNLNKSLYLLPWNEVLDTNQNEFLYSLTEMLLVSKLGSDYQHHCIQ
jgi:tetratricopeptide (TPR) repeat protein